MSFSISQNFSNGKSNTILHLSSTGFNAFRNALAQALEYDPEPIPEDEEMSLFIKQILSKNAYLIGASKKTSGPLVEFFKTSDTECVIKRDDCCKIANNFITNRPKVYEKLCQATKDSYDQFQKIFEDVLNNPEIVSIKYS